MQAVVRHLLKLKGGNFQGEGVVWGWMAWDEMGWLYCLKRRTRILRFYCQWKIRYRLCLNREIARWRGSVLGRLQLAVTCSLRKHVEASSVLPTSDIGVKASSTRPEYCRQKPALYLPSRTRHVPSEQRNQSQYHVIARNQIMFIRSCLKRPKPTHLHSLCTNPFAVKLLSYPSLQTPCPDRESISQTPKAKEYMCIPSRPWKPEPEPSISTHSQTARKVPKTTRETPLVNKLLDCLERLSKGMQRMCWDQIEPDRCRRWKMRCWWAKPCRKQHARLSAIDYQKYHMPIDNASRRNRILKYRKVRAKPDDVRGWGV
jgi:hypothetical protein